MKRRVLAMLLALCLLTGIMTTAALADDTQTGTIVYRQDDGTGHIYTGSGFLSFDSAAAAEAAVFQVGQSVSFTMTEGAITDGSLTVTSSTPMSLSLSGGGRVGESLAINTGSVPQIGTVSIRMYHAELIDEVFNSPDGEASSYDAAGFTALNHTVTEEYLGKYIGAELSYSVNVDGTDCSSILRAITGQAVAAALITEDTGDGDDSDTDIITHTDDGHGVYAGTPPFSVQVGSGTLVGCALDRAVETANGQAGSETVTITALQDSTVSVDTIPTLTRPTGAVVLDLGGFGVNLEYSVIAIDGADVTIKNGGLSGREANKVILVSSGKLKLESDLSLAGNPDFGVQKALIINGGEVTINGAKLESMLPGGLALSQNGGTLVINNGQFWNDVEINSGSAKLYGGSYGAGINVASGSVADILGVNYAYKYVTSSEWENDPGGLTSISHVTVEAAPLRVTGFTISKNSVDSDYAAGPVLSVAAEKVNAADAGDISYSWEYKCTTDSDFKTEDGSRFAVPESSVSSFALRTGLPADTYQFRCKVSLGDFCVTTEPVTLRIDAVCAAKIGEIEYPSFNAAAEYNDLDGKVITLMKDTTFNGTDPWVLENKTVTLDLNGHTLNFGSNAIEVSSTANLTVTDGSENHSGRLIADTPPIDTPAFIQVEGGFTVQYGSIVCTDGVALYSAGNSAARIVVNDGSITGSDAAVKIEPSSSSSYLLEISGGTFTATDAAGTALLSGVKTLLTGGTFINTGGGKTIASYTGSGKDIASFPAEGYRYYSPDGTGAVLVDDGGTYIAQSVTVSPRRVSTLDLTALIAAPTVGATPQTTFADQPDYTGTLSWDGEPEEFELGEVYTAKLSITPTLGYIIEGISETAGFSHTGASSVTLRNTDGKYYVTIVFTAVTAPTFVFATALTGAGVSGAFQINGTPFNTATIGKGADLGTTASSFATTYTSSGDANHPYPTGMKAFAMKSSDAGYGVSPITEFDNALQYMGSSIRTSGVKGVRMITGIPQELREKLLRAQLDGYRLMEYGTLVAFQSDIVNDSLTLDDSYAKHNYAYKRGASDAVFGNANGLTQFTNVLTNFTLEQCKKELGMRPYMILENIDGEEMILYGGIVYRSIGYIAWQNRDTYEPGTAEYRYIHEIIDYVYGANTPTD